MEAVPGQAENVVLQNTINTDNAVEEQHSYVTKPLQEAQKPKRKHRRGQKHNYNKRRKVQNDFRCGGGSSCSSMGKGTKSNRQIGNKTRSMKLQRSQSLVPYNTNKFLMEEHMAEFSSAIMTPSSQDEEAFLTKEFANMYEGARLERLEAMSKQQLIEEYLALEDRYSSEQRQKQHQQQLLCRQTLELTTKLHAQHERIRDLTAEIAALKKGSTVESPSKPTTAAPKSLIDLNSKDDAAMSEDSESDSSSSSSCSSISYSSSNSSISSSDVNNDDVDTSKCSKCKEEPTLSNNNDIDMPKVDTKQIDMKKKRKD